MCLPVPLSSDIPSLSLFSVAGTCANRSNFALRQRFGLQSVIVEAIGECLFFHTDCVVVSRCQDEIMPKFAVSTLVPSHREYSPNAERLYFPSHSLNPIAEWSVDRRPLGWCAGREVGVGTMRAQVLLRMSDSNSTRLASLRVDTVY